MSPVEIFEELETREIYDHILKQTVRNASICKNSKDFTMTTDDMKAFVFKL